MGVTRFVVVAVISGLVTAVGVGFFGLPGQTGPRPVMVVVNHSEPPPPCRGDKPGACPYLD